MNENEAASLGPSGTTMRGPPKIAKSIDGQRRVPVSGQHGHRSDF
jgi:hypothetical protein